MICQGCIDAGDKAQAANDNRRHSADDCDWPISCPCQHGYPIEQDPSGNPDIPEYIDQLASDDPRRLAYEKRVGRKIER